MIIRVRVCHVRAVRLGRALSPNIHSWTVGSNGGMYKVGGESTGNFVFCLVISSGPQYLPQFNGTQIFGVNISIHIIWSGMANI